MDSQQTVLITGINGFIGRTLCRRLVGEGCRVRGTTRVAVSDAGLPENVKILVSGPLEKVVNWPNLLNGVDAVIHLAARVHILQTNAAQQLPEFRKVNVEGTRKLARAAAEGGVRRFVFISSVKAVGAGSRVPYNETTPENPVDPYGISKLEAERAIKAIGEETGMETVILRLPLVYGPGVKANFLRLMKLVSKGVPLPFGRVSNRRSMLYLGNLVDAVSLCLRHENAAGKTFLVSDGEDLSTPGLIRLISGAMDKSARLFPIPPGMLKVAGSLTGRRGEVDRLLGSLQVDISRIRNVLKWEPPLTVKEGVAETVAWFTSANQHL